MSGIISLSYWFGLYPPALLRSATITLAVIFAALLVLGLVVLYVIRRKVVSKARKQAFGRLGHTILWAGITGAAWLFMTVNVVPILGMRIWFIVGAAFFAWLTVKPVRDLRTTIPAEERGAENRASYEKWLPKPKK